MDTDVVTAGCVPAWVASMIAATTAVLYVVIIVKQGPPYEVVYAAVVFLVIAGLAVSAALAGSTSRTLRIRRRCAAGSTCGLFALGFLAIFSIGLPLLVAGACALGAWVRLTAAMRAPAG